MEIKREGGNSEYARSENRDELSRTEWSLDTWKEVSSYTRQACAQKFRCIDSHMNQTVIVG